MKQYNKKILILAVVVIAIAVTVFLVIKNRNAEQPEVTNSGNLENDQIRERLNFSPVDAVVTKISGNKVQFTVGEIKATGVVTDETSILKQTNTPKGASIGDGKISDIAKGSRILVYPKPESKAEFNINQIQVLK